MHRPKDRRPTLTLKGEHFTPELRARINKAARVSGHTQASFVADVLDRAIREALGEPQSPDNLEQPDAPHDVQTWMDEIAARLDGLERQVAAKEKRSWWGLW